MAVKITENFTWKEFEQSSTARYLNIDNTIPSIYKDNIYDLAVLLQKIRNEFKHPIYVTSGYRCPKLNTAVGGSKTSAHMKGLAADIHASNNIWLWDCIMHMIDTGQIEVSQLIWEKGTDEYPAWIHIAIYRPGMSKHNQILYLR